MASVSVSHMILFIASLIVAASVAGTLTTGVDNLDDALSDRSLDVSSDIRTEIEVISDPGAPVYDTNGNQNVTLLVKNTGSAKIPLDADQLDVMVDGRYVTGVNVTAVDGPSWNVNDVARVEIDAGTLQSGDHRVKLVVDGDEEVFSFRV